MAFPPSGEHLRYWRCPTCEFIFTVDLDGLSSAELGNRIYNDDYGRADPEFAAERPRYFAGLLGGLVGPVKHRIEAIDFGGGRGHLAALMRGGVLIDNYDPYFEEKGWPTRTYNLVTAFEVVEHTRDPIGTFRQMLSLLQPKGAVVFSTLLQPRNVRPDWWYIAPRNGHVSIYSDRTLRLLALRAGARCLTMSDGLHVLYERAGWLPRFIASQRPRAVLYWASLRSTGALASATMQLFQLGCPSAALDPRHTLRLLLSNVSRGKAGNR